MTLLQEAYLKQKTNIFISPEVLQRFEKGRSPTLMSLAIASQIPDDEKYDALFANVVWYGCSWVNYMNNASAAYWEPMEILLINELSLRIDEPWVKNVQEMFATSLNLETLPVVQAFLKTHAVNIAQTPATDRVGAD